MGHGNPFASLFGKSPFKAVQQHMRVVTQCAELVPGIFEALVAGNDSKIKEIKVQIDDLEHQADTIKDGMRTHLHKSMFMPVDRRDLLELLNYQDNIADMAEKIAGLLAERRMEMPVGMGAPVVALAKRCIDACLQAGKIIEQLDELVETGFGGRQSELVMGMVEDLSKIETETNAMVADLLRSLFLHEDEIKPVSVILWYQMIHWINELADNAEKVGDRLRLLTAR
ncbi:MAG: TIGR00153 family protein [Magnetococcus sp. DMHC-6]